MFQVKHESDCIILLCDFYTTNFRTRLVSKNYDGV